MAEKSKIIEIKLTQMLLVPFNLDSVVEPGIYSYFQEIMQGMACR